MFNEMCFKQIGYAPVEVNLFVRTFQGKQSLPEATRHAWVLGERGKVGTSMEEFHCRSPLTTQQGRKPNQKFTRTLDLLPAIPRK